MQIFYNENFEQECKHSYLYALFYRYSSWICYWYFILDEQVIQKREDGSENFNRSWTDYELGFGSPASEVWLGIHVYFLRFFLWILCVCYYKSQNCIEWFQIKPHNGEPHYRRDQMVLDCLSLYNVLSLV